jgi:hypothetical protein
MNYAIASGTSHSFDTGIAREFGLAAAALYNHIHYWINHNRIKNINQREGKFWTYQSYREMMKYLPYLTFKQLRNAMQDLVKAGLVLKGKFNTDKFDHTPWYSTTSPFSDKDPNEPDSTSDSEIEVKKEDDEPQMEPLVENSNNIYVVPFLEPSTNLERARPTYIEDKKLSKKEHMSELARGLANFFFDRIKSFSPTFKVPNFDRWARDLDLLIRIDKRSEEDIRNYIIYCTSEGIWWRGKILCPETLRKHWDRLTTQISDTKKIAATPEDNFKKAKEILKKYILPSGLQIEFLNKQIEFIRIGASAHPICIEYSAKGFEDQLRSAIYKCGCVLAG